MDLKELGDADPTGHWYYETKFNSIFGKLKLSRDPKKIIEIGAGSKFFISKLLQEYPDSIGWAVDPNFTKVQLQKEGALNSVLDNPHVNGDLYLFLDVLEHVENDTFLLTSSLSTANPGATVVVSVPAFKHLWSGHDVFLGHHRRYNKNQLRNLMNSANLEIKDLYYTFSLIYPAVLILRKLKGNAIKSDMRVLKPIINSILYKILHTFSFFNSNKFFGLTVVAIARVK